MLNSRFFKRIYSTKDTTPNTPNVDFVAYSMVGHSMVLQSLSDGKYLACVQVLFTDTMYELPMIVQIPEQPNRFQIMFPTDFDNDNAVNSSRPFRIVITNLCSEGMIKMDFMKDGKPVDKVDDPERGLNKVNELHPYQSYEIEADQTCGNKRIMTEIVKKKNNDNIETFVNLSDEEKSSVENKSGSYLYLTVTCQSNIKSLEESFKQTHWITPDFIVTQEKPNYRQQYVQPYVFDEMPPGEGIQFNREQFGGYNSDDSSDSLDNNNNHLENFGQKIKNMALSFTDSCGNFGKSDDSEPVLRSAGSARFTESIKMGRPANSTNSTNSVKSNNNITEQINSSKVAKLTYGEDLEVNSNFTGLSYRYDLCSPMVKLGMSHIEKDFCKKPTVVESSDYGHIVIQEYIDTIKKIKENAYAEELKKMKTYISDACVMCLEEDMSSGIIFFRCGHICSCSSKCANDLTNCPMCRTSIVSKVERNFLTNLLI